ncbi:MAG: hypothetical protein L6R40_004719 [Gallowayella cf. fulva]|nr:MAG: hypothetical protein L6R40_004719 [Xanthomendoza cf. fulva]
MPFPFLRLPAEVRNMVYREFVSPPKDDAELKRWFHWENSLEARNKERERERQEESDATNLLLTNRQISGEASDILWRYRYFESQVESSAVGLQGRIFGPRLCCIPSLDVLPKLRNILITLGSANLDSQLTTFTHIHGHSLATKFLGLLSNDLASHSAHLNNVTVYLPCWCQHDHLYHGRCFAVDGIERLLAPLGRIRARSLRFVCDCKRPMVSELQPVIEDLAAIVQSTEPAEPLSSQHTKWMSIRQEARRRGQLEQMKQDLVRSWCVIDGGIESYHGWDPIQTLEEKLEKCGREKDL